MDILKTLLLPIIAWFMIIVGTLMLIWPEMARGRIVKNSAKMLLGWLLMAGLFLLSLVSAVSQKTSGWIGLIGLIAIICGALWIWKTSLARITGLVKNLSTVHLRIFAAGHIVLGGLMLILKTLII
ncbi:MAG: hypothetical protein GX606_04830 [Elusimicrobia bacterium]|nr:hypothetical protein [Elusimicrobiota bacterium]